MAKKKSGLVISKTVLLVCVVAGLATVALRMLNRRLQVPEFEEVAGYAGTIFAVALIIVIGTWIVSVINKR